MSVVRVVCDYWINSSSFLHFSECHVVESQFIASIFKSTGK